MSAVLVLVRVLVRVRVLVLVHEPLLPRVSVRGWHCEHVLRRRRPVAPHCAWPWRWWLPRLTALQIELVRLM